MQPTINELIEYEVVYLKEQFGLPLWETGLLRSSLTTIAKAVVAKAKGYTEQHTYANSRDEAYGTCTCHHKFS